MTYTDQEKNCIGRIIHLKLIFCKFRRVSHMCPEI